MFNHWPLGYILGWLLYHSKLNNPAQTTRTIRKLENGVQIDPCSSEIGVFFPCDWNNECETALRFVEIIQDDDPMLDTCLVSFNMSPSFLYRFPSFLGERHQICQMLNFLWILNWSWVFSGDSEGAVGLGMLFHVECIWNYGGIRSGGRFMMVLGCRMFSATTIYPN